MDKEYFWILTFPLILGIAIQMLPLFGGIMLQNIKPPIQLGFFCFAIALIMFAFIGGIACALSSPDVKQINIAPVVMVALGIGVATYPLLYKYKDRIYPDMDHAIWGVDAKEPLIVIFNLLHDMNDIVVRVRAGVPIKNISQDDIIRINILYSQHGAIPQNRFEFYVRLNALMGNLHEGIDPVLANISEWDDLNKKLDNVKSIIGDDETNELIEKYINFIIGQANDYIYSSHILGVAAEWHDRGARKLLNTIEAKLSKRLKKFKGVKINVEL